jgi:hypothetical protein
MVGGAPRMADYNVADVGFWDKPLADGGNSRARPWGPEAVAWSRG